MSLEGRVAVITGATGALGVAISHSLADQGVNLALLDRESERLATLSKELSLPDDHLFTRTLDLLDPVETNSAAAAVMKKYGRVDILLHLIGGWTGGKTLLEAPSADLAFMLNQHVWPSFNVIQAFVPHLVSNGWGRVIMISSPYASRPVAKGGPYAVAKSGQEAMLLVLSQELKGTRVTANLLLARTIDSKREKVSMPTPENSTWTSPEELVAAILFLLGDPAGTVNGARIPLYGSY